jgi:hypothetical protein
VQDGLGAQLNVTLERPAILRVTLMPAPVRSVVMNAHGRKLSATREPAPARLYLIPHRWWPALATAVVPPGRSSVEFRGIGGPLRKGLIAAS